MDEDRGDPHDFHNWEVNVDLLVDSFSRVVGRKRGPRVIGTNLEAKGILAPSLNYSSSKTNLDLVHSSQ